MRVKDREMMTGRRDSQAGGAAYDHARLARRRRLLRWVADNIGFRFVVKLDRVEGLENLPARGAAILMTRRCTFWLQCCCRPGVGSMPI